PLQRGRLADLGVMDLRKQTGERLRKMRLVENDERILPEQPRINRPQPRRKVVSAEQQPAANHVHRADDDRRFGGIVRPFAVVSVLAAEGADGGWIAKERSVLLE